MDDTIEDLGSAWAEYLSNKYADRLTYKKTVEDFKEWDVCKAFPELTKEEIFEPLESDDFWCSVKPYKDAVKYIPLLYDKFTLYICTNSGYKTIKNKAESVLFKYFPCIRWSDVVVTASKQLINADYLVDDNPDNLIGGKYKKILFTRPHNKWFDATANDVVRVYCWKEIYDHLCSECEQKKIKI